MLNIVVDSYSGVATLAGLCAAGKAGTVIAVGKPIAGLVRRVAGGVDQRVADTPDRAIALLRDGGIADLPALVPYWQGDPAPLGKQGRPVIVLAAPPAGRPYTMDALVEAVAGGAAELAVRIVHCDRDGRWAAPVDVAVPLPAGDDLAAAGSRVAGCLLAQLAAKVTPQPGDLDPPAAAPPRLAFPERLDWTVPAASVTRTVMALAAPGPGAHTAWRDTVLRVHRARPAGDAGGSAAPGTVLAAGEAEILVRARDRAVWLGGLRDRVGPVATARVAVGDRLGADLHDQAVHLRQRVVDLEHAVRALLARHDVLG